MHKAFTDEDDTLLMKYIATYNPQLKGRLGMKLYERLVENAERKWSFSSRHPVQSWRERYKNNQLWFDAQILKYQKKHGISANTFDDSSFHSKVQSGVRKPVPVGLRSRTNIPGGSTAPAGENRTKKRLRELVSDNANLDSSVAKKRRREKVSSQGTQPRGSPPLTRSPSTELRNGEDKAIPIIGSDDYTGALSGSGESDQEVECQSEGRGVNPSARLPCLSSTANNAEMKSSLAPRKSPSPCLVGATAAQEVHNFSSKAVVTKVSELVRELVDAPLQLSQEPTPPHTSAINSPRSPFQCQPSPTNSASSRPGIVSRHMSTVSQKLKRVPPSQRKQTIVSRDGDDIFSSPPQVVRASPPLRSSRKEAPRLVEGPFRSAYSNANGQLLRDRCPSGTDEEVEADGEYEEWPPRRGKQKSVISFSRDKLSPIVKRRLSTHDFIQAKGPARATSHNRLSFPAASAHELPPPVPGPPPKHASLNRYPNSAALNDSSVNDPFLVPLVNREARRWTLAADNKIPRVDTYTKDRRASVQHIDLRALHSGKSVGTSPIGGTMSINRSNTSESSSVAKKKGLRKLSKSSTPANLSESNKELVLALGLEVVYSRMAKNHKFHIDIVREVAARQRSLEDADRVLRNMREAAGREYARLLRQDEASVGCETGESEEEDENNADKSRDEEDDSEHMRPSRVSLGSNHSPRSLVLHGRVRHSALKITTAYPGSSPTRPPDYSPPTPTRAHVFRRLEREGRVEEARLREARHVRRSLGPNSAEASPETDEQRIITYLLQLQEDDEVEPQNTNRPERLGERDRDDETHEDERVVGPSISPGFEGGHADADIGLQGNAFAEDVRAGADVAIGLVCDPGGPDDAHNNVPPRPLGQDSRGIIDEDGPNVTTAFVDTKLYRMSELEDEDAETVETEEQVDAGADDDCQTSCDLYAIGPEEQHVSSTGVDDGVIVSNEQQTLPRNVLTEDIRHDNFFLEREYAPKATSSLPCSVLATLSVLDINWTNSDDEILLDGDLIAHEELVRRKGLSSVKLRTAHLYSLLVDALMVDTLNIEC